MSDPTDPAPADSGALRSELAAALDRLGLRDETLLVAVSGGVDSTALLHGLAELAPERGGSLAVAHVHHGLRGESADADALHVERSARALGLPFALARVDPEALREGRSSRERPTLQEAARHARYGALEAERERVGARRIATAHTADDQAETVLLRILRGSGPDGLAGIPERSPDGRIVRPLLGVSRAEVLGYARARGLAWREDPSNSDPRFARARLRPRLAELARDFNPQLLNTLVQLADAHRRDAEWIDELVAAEAGRRVRETPRGVELDRRGWAELPPALALRLVRRVWCDHGGGRDLSRVHLERVHAALAGGRAGATIELPGELRIALERDVGVWLQPSGRVGVQARDAGAPRGRSSAEADARLRRDRRNFTPGPAG